MKSADAGMITHIEGHHLTVCLLWTLTRVDGTILRFTDHDSDITYSSNTYAATSGFKRSPIQARADLSADNLDLQGLLEAGFVTSLDIRRHKYDFADIEVRFVNWGDLTDGEIKLRKGTLGEVKLVNGGYQAELRGMSQLLARRIVELYTPDCRADLGDSRCGFDITTLTETTEIDTVSSVTKFLVPTFATKDFTASVVTPEYHKALVNPTTNLITMLPDGPADGTPLRPYEIGTQVLLENFHDGTLGDLASSHFVLTADIDMSASVLWTPVSFGGVLDGRGYKITELDLDTSSAAVNTAMFNVMSGTIRRVHLDNPFVQADGTKYSCGFAITVTGLIEECIVSTDDDDTTGHFTYDADFGAPVAGILDSGGQVNRCLVHVVCPQQGFTLGANTIDIKEDGGGLVVTTVGAANYQPKALADAMATALNANGSLVGVYTVVVSADQRTFTLAATGLSTLELEDTAFTDNINLTAGVDRTGSLSYAGTAVPDGIGANVGSIVGLITSGTVADNVADANIAGHAQLGSGESASTLVSSDFKTSTNSAFDNHDQANDFIWAGGNYPRFIDPGRC